MSGKAISLTGSCGRCGHLPHEGRCPTLQVERPQDCRTCQAVIEKGMQ